jgi:hypothetical protein
MNTVAALVTVVSITYGSTENASTQQDRLVKKVLLGGDGEWDYFTVDPATHRIFMGREPTSWCSTRTARTLAR